MPKYFDFKVFGYYPYFTSHCVVEAMHVHASDRRLAMYEKWSQRSTRGFFGQ